MGLDMCLRDIKIYHIEKAGKLGMSLNDYVNANYDKVMLDSVGIERNWVLRNAGHIHNWFVQNVQNGRDDGGVYVFSKRKANELTKICRHILVHLDEAPKYLPVTNAYGYGPRDYDQWYFDSVMNMLRILEEAFDFVDFKKKVLVYYANW